MEAPHHKYCKCPDCELFAQMQAHFGTNEPEPNTRAGEALKPCPFCGVAAIPHHNQNVSGGIMVAHPGRTGCPLDGHYMPITAWNTRPLPQPSELVERPSEAIEVLGGPYRQLDMDGVIVGVSRQAIYETLTYLTQLEAQIAKLQADGDKLAGALEQLIKHTTWLESVAPPMCIDGKYMGESLSLADACQALTEWKDRA